jgi:hypothetical protein
MPPLKFRKSDLTEQVAFRCMGIRGQEQGSIFSRVRRIRQPDPAGSGRKLELPDRLRRARRPTAPRLQKIAPNCPKIVPNRPKSRPASGISGFPAKPPDRIRHAVQTEIEPWSGDLDRQGPTIPQTDRRNPGTPAPVFAASSPTPTPSRAVKLGDAPSRLRENVAGISCADALPQKRLARPPGGSVCQRQK